MSGHTETLYCTIEASNQTFTYIGRSHAHGAGGYGGWSVHDVDLYRCDSCGFVRAYPPKIASDP